MKWTLFILLVLVFKIGLAQLCTGSLGDPIRENNFGAGTNPGPSLSKFSTNYSFSQNDCPLDGSYTVRNNTLNCFNNSWHSLPGDHTGNPSGYMMIVNAADNPGVFYVDTVKGLCSNTTFQFAAWMVNLLKPDACQNGGSKPNLTFFLEKLDGTVLQSYNTGDIAPTNTPEWKQYGFFFFTQATDIDIVLRIINNAPGGCGNDLALDDITFRPCSPKIIADIDGNGGNAARFCAGKNQNVVLSANATGANPNTVYQWQKRTNGGAWIDIAGATNIKYNAFFPISTLAGLYEFRVATANQGNIASLQCRTASEPVSVIIDENPLAVASSNSPICSSEKLLLMASMGTSYLWNGPAGFTSREQNPIINNPAATASGDYKVVIYGAQGCSSTATTKVSILNSPQANATASFDTLCVGKSATLNASGGTMYKWFPASGLSDASIANPTALPAITTTYRVSVTDGGVCADTAEIKMNVIQSAIANAGSDINIVVGQTATLKGFIRNPYRSFIWSPNIAITQTNILNPIVNPLSTQAYVLTVTSPFNCGVSSDSVLVSVYNGIYIPNSFTPNADGRNDRWDIPALYAFSKFTVTVYNRYGQRVFSSSRADLSWDGRFKSVTQPPGVYVYVINGDGKIYKGTLLLIR